MKRTSKRRHARPIIKDWRVIGSPKVISGLAEFMSDPLKLEYKVSDPCVIQGSVCGVEELIDESSLPVLVSSFTKIGSLSLNQYRMESGKKNIRSVSSID